MNDPGRRAELEKLARVLDTDYRSVLFLAYLETAQLRALREGITDALFDKFRPSFRGFARMATKLPAAISARISQRVLGPLLSARVAGEMEADRAIELAARLSDDFLADTCVALDPQRARPIIAGFPVDRAVAITRVLLARGQFITMGQFVDVLPGETLLACADAIDSAADLLRVSFFVEQTRQIDTVIAHLDTARRRALIEVAAAQDLWPEVIATLARIGEPGRLDLARLALEQDDATLNTLIAAAAENDLWPTLLALGRDLPDAEIVRLARQPAFGQTYVVRSIIDSVVANDLWQSLLGALPVMGAHRCARLLEVAASDRPAFLADLGGRIAGDDAADALRAAATELADATRKRAILASRETALARLLAEPAR